MGPLIKSVKEMHCYVLIAFASILWGTMGILAKFSYEYSILPETLIALRLLISFSTLLIVLALFHRNSLRIHRKDMLLFLIFGVSAIALQRVSYFYAVNLTTATMAALLFYTYPVFVTLLASLFLKEKITIREVLAIILTFMGVAFVVRVYDTASLNANLFGIIFGMLSSLLFVLYFVIVKKLRNSYTSWTLTLYGDGIGALALTPIISFSFQQIITFPMQLWLLILIIAWVPSLVAYLLYSYALKHVKASKGSILSVIEPLSAALFSAVFLGENLESLQMIGIALALVGVILLLQVSKAKT